MIVKKKLRSQEWFWGHNETGLLHQGALRSAGIDMDHYTGQPVIGIANTWSEFNSCNMSLRAIAAEVKQGIFEAGGIAVEFPVMSLGEELMKPSAMLYRNLLSLEVEENIRAYPIDGIVLLGNCDKTIPGLLMGAVSSGIPTIQLNGGPKKAGFFRGEKLGSGTDLWRYWDELRAGHISEADWQEIGKQLSCGYGACNTMGTSSTMNAALEALGIMPLGMSTLPVNSTERYQLSRNAGQRIVEMVYEGLVPSAILTLAAFKNAITLCMALGGSTNAVIHLTAIAGRLNIQLFPDAFTDIGTKIPCICDIQPSGTKLIEELEAAGGIPAVLKRLEQHLDLSATTITGRQMGDLLAEVKSKDSNVIMPIDNPIKPAPTLAVLHGNIAPRGAVIKVSAASESLLQHRGKALVFENYQDMLNRIDTAELEVDASSILVLKNAGPKGVPGMPEWGMIPIPKKLIALGVKDMIRISDSRMSGTSFGTVILHVTPEAALGGAFAVIKTGDVIHVDIPNRQLELMIKPSELESRLKLWLPKKKEHMRGYPLLYEREVLQADQGCDFAFLKPTDNKSLNFIPPTVGRS